MHRSLPCTGKHSKVSSSRSERSDSGKVVDQERHYLQEVADHMAKNWKTSISWEATVHHDAADLDMGQDYQPTVGMELIGTTYDGWRNLVYLQVELPDSTDVLSETLNIREFDSNKFRDFNFPTFTAPTGGQITITATTKQEAILQSALVIADKVKIDDGKYTRPLHIRWNLEFKMDYDAQALTPLSTYQFIVPLMLKGDSLTGWNQPVNLEVTLPGGKKVAKKLDPKLIPLNSSTEFTTREFIAPDSDKKVTITVSTVQGTNLHSMLVVGDVEAKLY